MSAEWSNATRGVQFLWLPIPAYASLPILIWIMHATWVTFCIAIVTCLTLTVLRTKGIQVPWLIRRSKQVLRGSRIHARSLWWRRRTHFLTSLDSLPLGDKQGAPK